MLELDYKLLTSDLGGPAGVARLLVLSPFRASVPPDSTIAMWIYRDSMPGDRLAAIILAYEQVYERTLDLLPNVKGTLPMGVKRRNRPTTRTVGADRRYQGGAGIFA